MDFSQALLALKEGQSVFRSGWNGKQMLLLLQLPTPESKMTKPYIYMRIPCSAPQFDGQETFSLDGFERIPWLASQADLLSMDWEVDL